MIKKIKQFIKSLFVTEQKVIELKIEKKTVKVEKYKYKIKPFDANKITLHNWEGIHKVQKKPLIIHAVQINFPEGFTVDTLEGTMTGKPGDYLMFGIDGEKYICDRDIFERTYDILDK